VTSTSPPSPACSASFVEAEQVAVLDADGKEIERRLMDQQRRPTAPPKGGKVKQDAHLRIFKQRGLRLPHHHRRAPAARRGRQGRAGREGQAEGQAAADSSLRDTENVPLSEDVETYFKREVLPHAPDAWIDHDKTKVGYEIPVQPALLRLRAAARAGRDRCRAEEVTDRIKAMIEGLSA
jgi:type I restriction enzyme M protein